MTKVCCDIHDSIWALVYGAAMLGIMAAGWYYAVCGAHWLFEAAFGPR